MYLLSNKNRNSNLFNFLLSMLPISFIAGNMVININVLIIIFLTLFFFYNDFFKIKINFQDKLLITFFALIIVTGFYNDLLISYSNKEFAEFRGGFYTSFKSLLFLKYLLFYFAIKYLIQKNIVNLKFFFLVSSFAAIFVCIDILIQFIFGKDLFGIVADSSRKLGGPFGSELIAGGYIQRFSLFAFFVLPLYLNIKNKKVLSCLVVFLIIIFLVGLILAGNRMPMILFLLLMFLILLFQKSARKFFFPFVFIVPILVFTAMKSNEKVSNNFTNLYMQVSGMAQLVFNYDSNKTKAPQYYKEFATFYDTWLLNKYLGGGIKNFRYYCHVRPNIDKNSTFVCNMHPHNYYLEILTETGLIGFFIIVIFYLIILKKTFYKKYFLVSNLQNNNLIVPFIFLFIIEIFPIKSSGSFFTTGNATYLFLILGILVGLIEKNNLIEKKN